MTFSLTLGPWKKIPIYPTFFRKNEEKKSQRLD
jgi:hypothetical protein